MSDSEERMIDTVPSDFFHLDEEFLEQFKTKTVDWGPVGYVVYKRTYARKLETGLLEEWWQTVKRVVEGTYTIQKWHCRKNHTPWVKKKAQKSAQRMYELMFDFKMLPPGRGLEFMGTDVVYRIGSGCLQNCGVCSTKDIDKDFSDPFVWLMEMSMLGTGVGFDNLGAGKFTIPAMPATTSEPFVVEDSREGWVAALKVLLDGYSGVCVLPVSFDLSLIRPKGAPIKRFGGTAPGPEPLARMLTDVRALLAQYEGKLVDANFITTLCNLIGVCVVSGGRRRTALLSLGDPEDQQFLDLKNYDINPQRADYGWTSNNSVAAEIGMDYSKVAKNMAINGEPGAIWLDNCRRYSRMNGKADNKDKKVAVCNPCVEMCLHSKELCTLVESLIARCSSYEEFQEVLKYAYLYGKTVTLVPTQNKDTNSVMTKNRRIGCSVTGITRSFYKIGRQETFKWLDQGYDYLIKLDKVYSDWFGVHESIKMSTVKPSGTISLLPGEWPGIHHPEDEYYYRVIRVQDNSPIVKKLSQAGYKVYDLAPREANTVAIYFPVKTVGFVRGVRDVSMMEQLEIAAQVQSVWADNAVSCTVSFHPHEAKDIKYALELYETRLKGVSFLPHSTHGYEHAPYQTITKEEYDLAISFTKPYDLSDLTDGEVQEKFCDSTSCSIT